MESEIQEKFIKKQELKHKGLIIQDYAQYKYYEDYETSRLVLFCIIVFLVGFIIGLIF